MQEQFVEDVSFVRKYSPLEFVRKYRDNQIFYWDEELCSRNMVKTGRFGFNNFFVNKPDYIEHVLLTHAERYSKPDMARRVIGPFFGNGLLLSEGEFWRRQRRIAAPAFHSKRIQEFVATFARICGDLLAEWEKRAESFDICQDMQKVTLRIIGETMFSTDIGSDIGTLGRLTDSMVHLATPNPLDILGMPEWIPRWRNGALKKAVDDFDAMITRVLAARRKDGSERQDLLAMLQAARDPDSGEGMTDKQLRDEIATIFAAGHETTANALGWVWYLLATHEHVEARLHRELDRVLGGRAPDFADLAQLPYCKMVFEEAIRLYPPAHSVTRAALVEDHIGGVRIPARSFIFISPYALHRNPKLWPEPEIFDPERFAPEAVAARHRFAYLPFGGGPRICIGMAFAMAEAVTIMAMIAQRFRIRLAPGPKIEPIGLLTLRARNGIRVCLERRSAG